jgi:hypothetical protein
MKNFFSVIALVFFSFVAASQAYAFCPICTLAVGAGVGLSRWLGIDDVITGLWIGGLAVSVSFWTIGWLRKKNYIFFARPLIIILGYYALIIFPLYFTGIIGHPFNRFWGLDKLLLGIIIGSIFFYLGGVWYQRLKKKNNNRAYFPMQKVAMPVGVLIILSFIFYFITRK